MPAGIAGAAEVVPAHSVAFAGLDELPEGKIGGVALGVAKLYPGAGLEMVKVKAGEIGVTGKLAGVKVDAVGSFVGVALGGQAVHEGLIFFNVVGGAGEHIRGCELEGAKIAQELFDVEVSHLPNGFIGFAGAFF